MAQANVTNTLVVPVETKVAPYFDDFDESKNFHRILFRPGYAVQARELTQLQTILQNQVERFGRHIFVNGSPVIGGKLDIADIITLNVQTEYANSSVNISDFKDKTITLQSNAGSILARVVQTTSGSGTTPGTLHIKYLTGNEFSPGDVITTTTGDVTTSISPSANAKSNGVIAFLYDSIYFTQGYFVKTPSQSIVLSKHDRVPTAKVGLQINEEFVTEGSDSSLLDPALESSNYQAPGASRYKLSLELAPREINSIDDEKFIQIALIEDGIIKERVNNPIYSEIGEVLARRTYDESGNYIVNPFFIKLEESTQDSANNFTAKISPGKAYLYGYETEVQSTLSFEVPKARDYLSKTNYNLNFNYGNYVLVDNLKGAFNTGMGLVDIHCVKSDQINTSSQAAYNSTKIGTTRLRDLEFFSGSSNTAQRTYEFYFADNKFNVLGGTAGSLTIANNQIHLGNTANVSLVDDAYTGAFIQITGGASNGDVREIISYNGANRIANVKSDFTTKTNNTSIYQITFDISDADSFYQSIVYTGASVNASATISLSNKDDGTYNGNTFVNEPAFSTGFTVYPNQYIRNTSDRSYTYRKVYNTVQFTAVQSSVITASTDEQFVGASSSSNTSSTVTDNWLVIVTDKLSSSRNVGDQILVTTSIAGSVPEQAVLNSANTSESFIATVYAKVTAFDTATTPRVKTLVLANTQTFTADTADATFENASGSTTTVYLDSGQVVIKNPSSTEAESLYISDVIAAVKIYAFSSELSAGTDLNAGLDVTERYTIDIGQKPTHYDHASIRLKPGYASPKGYLVVCLRYYKSSNDKGFFSVDSYPFLNTAITENGKNIGTGYSLIPKVANVKLSDVIDFRPVRPNASNNAFFTFTSARIPVATTDFISDYTYYLERWDQFVLTLDGKIERIQGTSSLNPTFATQPERSLLLHRLRIRPYTETVVDVFINTINHRRYTMKDIAGIDQRLKNVEYAVTLNTLEKRAEDIVIRDADGLDRTKYGILAESFSSHLLADSTLPDYSCAIDLNKKYTPTEGMLMPKMFTKEVTLKPEANTSTNISIHDDKILLAYTTAPAISQPTATKSSPVAEFLFADFRGNIMCVPEGDIWKDTTVLPPTVISLPPPQIIKSEPVIINKVIKETVYQNNIIKDIVYANNVITVYQPGNVINTIVYANNVIYANNIVNNNVYVYLNNTTVVENTKTIIVYNNVIEYTTNTVFVNNNVYINTTNTLVNNVYIDTGPKTCFTGNSLVKMSDGSLRRIDEVNVGDYVATPEGRDARVEDIHRPIVGNRGLLSINGCKPFATSDHLFKSEDNKWIVADLELAKTLFPSFSKIIENGDTIEQMKIGDTIQTDNGSVTIETFEVVGKENFDNTTVYDLTLDDESSHTYIVNDFVVHNCGIIDPPPANVSVTKVMLLTSTPTYQGLGQVYYDTTTGQTSNNNYKVEDNSYQTAGLTDGAYHNFMTNAVNSSGYVKEKINPDTKIMDYVNDAYYEILDRPPEVDGAAYWIAKATTEGKTTKNEINRMILQGAIDSGEIVNPLVTQDSTVSLNPKVVITENEIPYKNPNLVVDNKTYAGVYTAADAAGSTRDLKPEKFITELYENILGRSPGTDPGYNYWLEQYKNNNYSRESAQSIIDSFYLSEEYKNLKK